MGCDIHSFAEVRKDGIWEKVENVFPLDDFDKKYYNKDFGSEPFSHRSYGLFAWLADVRNYSDITPICEPKDIPDDVSPLIAEEYESWEWDAHSASWLSVKEMLDVDYAVEIWDRRVVREVSPNHFSGGCLAEEGEGDHTTLNEFLEGTEYFETLDILKTLGDPEDVRVIFWFDN